MLRISSFTFAFAVAAYAADPVPEASTPQEKTVVAKVALEWLIFDDSVKPESGEANDLWSTRVVERLRKRLQSSRAVTFPVGIMGAHNEVVLPLLYDRAAKTVLPREKDPPGWNPGVFYVTIGRKKDAWGVRIRNGAISVGIEVKCVDELCHVSKFNYTLIHD